MESNKDKKYSIGIPILFLLLFLSSLVGIIGAAFRYDTAQKNDPSADHTMLALRIVVAAILTALFFLVMLFGFMEIGEPKNYKTRFLTNTFERRLRDFSTNLESWELVLLLSNYLTLPIGVAVALIDSNTGYLWMSFASIGAVTWSYNYRIGTRNAIKRILPRHREIALSSLSQAVSRDQNRVKKTIMYLISYEDYPATFDFGTQVITYHGPDGVQNPLSEDVVVAETTSTTNNSGNATKATTKKKTKQVKLNPCPFCDTMPIDARARFCHDCGASIIPAK